MTRINCVPPSELTGKHLVAEYREIGRVFALVRAAVKRKETIYDTRNPKAYTLGTGHVRFFYSRLRYVKRRFLSLVEEMEARGYRPKFTSPPDSSDIPLVWFGDWVPDATALAINRARIKDRLSKKVVDGP